MSTMKKEIVMLKKAPAYRFVVFILMALCYVLVYAGTQTFAALAGDIMNSVGIGAGKMSLLSSIGTLAMAIFSFFAGVFMGKFGGKKVIIGGLLVMALSGVLYLTNPASEALLYLFRIIQGFGCGATNSALMALVSAWFPSNERGMAQGILSCFYGASVSVGTFYVFLCKDMAWYQTMGYMFLGGGVIFALLILLFYKDIEKAHGVSIIDEAIEGYTAETATPVAGQEAKSAFHKAKNWSEALKSPAFWLTGIMMFFYCSSCYGTAFVFPLFLTGSGLDAAASTSVMSLGSISTILFCLVGGVLSDKLFHSKRTPVTMMAFGGSAIFFTIIALVIHSVPIGALIALYFIAFGLLNFAGGPAWALPAEVVAPEFAQQNTGNCLLFANIGGFIMTTVAGILMENVSVAAGFICIIACQVMVFVLALLLRLKCKV